MSRIINIKFGDKPLAHAVIERAKESYMAARNWTAAMRDDALTDGAFLLAGYINEAPAFDKAMSSLSKFETDLIFTMETNAFNAQLEAYGKATARLSRYALSEGRAEVTGEVETGAFDENGDPVTEAVVVQTAIEALPETVEITEYDDEGNETVSTVPNPSIVQDEAERAQAQSVIDSTPEAVIAYVT
jgi:hypothetical protein